MDAFVSNVNIDHEHRNAESAQGIAVFPKVNAWYQTLPAFVPAIKHNLVRKVFAARVAHYLLLRHKTLLTQLDSRALQE